MAAILDIDMNLLSIMFFYAFYQLNNGSIGFLVSEKIQKDSSFMFLCQLFPKISQFTDIFVSMSAILDFF